jgi:hypothetical protein
MDKEDESREAEGENSHQGKDIFFGAGPNMNRGPVGGPWPGAANAAPPAACWNRTIPNPAPPAAHFNRVPGGSTVPGESTVSTNNSVAVFGRANHRTLEEIVLDEIIVQKEDRGTPGSKIFVSNRLAATQGLSIKFLGSIHLLSKNAAGENMQKAKNIQDQFVSNLDMMAKLAERIKQYDMLLPLQVPKDYYDIVNVED